MNKLRGPGLFRLLLALAVLVDHATRLAIGVGAVYLFFSLSGYWIFRMYSERYAHTCHPYLTYMTSRCWRLLPVFLLCGGLLLALNPGAFTHTRHPLHLAISETLILGYASLVPAPLGPAWSLDIEVQFYLIAPLIALNRRGWVWWKILIPAAIGVSVLSASLGISAWVGRYIAFFMAGMAFAACGKQVSKRLAFWSLGAGLVLLCGLAVSPWHGIILIGAHPTPLARYYLTANTVLAVALFPFAMHTTSQRGFRRDGMFADLSYIVYLLHWIVLQEINSHPIFLRHRVLGGLAAVAIIAGASWAIWKVFDKPLNRLRAAWVKQRMAPVADRKSVFSAA